MFILIFFAILLQFYRNILYFVIGYLRSRPTMTTSQLVAIYICIAVIVANYVVCKDGVRNDVLYKECDIPAETKRCETKTTLSGQILDMELDSEDLVEFCMLHQLKKECLAKAYADCNVKQSEKFLLQKSDEPLDSLADKLCTNSTFQADYFRFADCLVAYIPEYFEKCGPQMDKINAAKENFDVDDIQNNFEYQNHFKQYCRELASWALCTRTGVLTKNCYQEATEFFLEMVESLWAMDLMHTEEFFEISCANYGYTRKGTHYDNIKAGLDRTRFGVSCNRSEVMKCWEPTITYDLLAVDNEDDMLIACKVYDDSIACFKALVEKCHDTDQAKDDARKVYGTIVDRSKKICTDATFQRDVMRFAGCHKEHLLEYRYICKEKNQAAMLQCNQKLIKINQLPVEKRGQQVDLVLGEMCLALKAMVECVETLLGDCGAEAAKFHADFVAELSELALHMAGGEDCTKHGYVYRTRQPLFVFKDEL